MLEEILKARIGSGETAIVEPKGFWPGVFPVKITLYDEPGNRKLVVTLGDQKITQELSKPHGQTS